MGELVNDYEMDVRMRIDTLVSWASAHGAALHPAVDVFDDAQTGLSFRVKPSARTPLQPFEPVVRLPTSLTLSYLDALADESPRRFSKAFLAKAPPHVVGRLFLAKEYLTGRDSFWWPYIQALPQPHEPESWALPPFWPAEEAELLEGTNVEVGIEKIRGDVKREWNEARELLRQHGDDEVFGRALTATLYQWAYCIFSSRSFRPSLVLSETQRGGLPEGVAMDDFSVLLPLFDIGNHDMTTEIRWDLDDAGQRCELKVGKAHGAGEQIFNNYSMKTNAELLLGYGFMVPATADLHNDYTHVRKRTAAAPVASDEYLISLRPLSDPSSLLGRSKQTLRLDPATQVLGAFQHVQPDMAWDIFCTLTPPAQRERLIPGEGDDARRDSFFAGRVDGEGRLYLEQTVAVIQHKVLQELERLNETDVEVVGGDLDLLTRNQRLALDYRERCRQVLENTLGAMSQDEVLNDLAKEQ
ncbi:Protein-lysine N-methyltransferase EFM1 [Tolypocladium paradoxum]|uniref:Protein-lysine N-methyltransferase EFM1 n=1 Tax=Tolypocladium paradoxum TaxID=94208 RepID=A0A2S4KS12_9HYPO|nr:Protein-lysine N-methyltransferase EFM1 [Tolypocladium paradoxum]